MSAVLERKHSTIHREPSKVSVSAKHKAAKQYDVDGLVRMSREGLKKSIKENSIPGWTQVI